MFRILSIDGGGFRGVYSAHILKRIEEEYKVEWTKHFDMITGTSTGSIIAAGLVAGISAVKMTDLYEKLGKTVFKKSFFGRFPLAFLFISPYNAGTLRRELDNAFGTKTLGDISFPLLIPATDIGNGGVHIFKSHYDSEFVRDKDVKLSNAVLASCSAPMYFKPHKTDGYLLADGGLWANSPAIIAAIDAKRRLNKRLEELQILSIGTCGSNLFYSIKNSENSKWGLAHWGKQLVDMILNLQAQSANNMLGLLLERNQILRIDGESNIALDDTSMIDDLITRADKDFTHNSLSIKKFLQER